MAKAGAAAEAAASAAEATAATVERLLTEPLQGLGLTLLEVQFRQEGRWVLRLLVEQAGGGADLHACAQGSELASRLLDMADLIAEAYTLEVSSPGLFRPLRQRRHFAQSVGRRVRITLDADWVRATAPPGGRGAERSGLLLAVTDDAASLALQPGGEVLHAPLECIRKARLDPDL